ncbi:3-oxoacyl-[acyl-carrier-protein] reductase [Candidatus Avelusimicrobium aviculae]|uniref:3-oxoacyl-[acyl-carrier-protein] reductase n=1 Tax=Candidatus Avelusimicrobium aviculae TaxID=3416206 RepID=UPI003D10F623
MDFKGKNIIVTGATRGIGLTIAEAFAKQGANVAICGTREDAVNKAAENLAAFGGKVLGRAVNISRAQECDAFVADVVKEFGSLDVLVNNAGITKDNLAVRMTEEDWRAVIDVNLTGTFFMSKAALKVMFKKRAGNVVNISSVVGEMGNAGQANYVASKAGIIGLTKTLAKEFGSRNIRVNAVAPGFVRTAMTDALPQDVKEKALENVPLKRFAETQDIAKAVLFLASEDASYITGHILSVNGGLYI